MNKILSKLLSKIIISCVFNVRVFRRGFPVKKALKVKNLSLHVWLCIHHPLQLKI